MTRLGNAKECAKQGRYGRVMGDHWRSKERAGMTFAANGLLLDIWSYCADQATDEVDADAMRKLTSADRTHATRMVRQLVAAGHLAPTAKGWHVPGWKTLNPIARVPQLRVVAPAEPRATARPEARPEALPQVQPHREIIQEPCVSRARAETQDPRVKERTPPAGAPAPQVEPLSPAAQKPREPRRRDQRKEAFRKTLGKVCREQGLLARDALRPKQLEAAVGKAEEYAEREGIEFEAAALKLLGEAAAQVKTGQKSALCWAVRDWQPGVATPSGALLGPRRALRVERAVCSPVESFGTVEEFEAKWAAREAAHG